MIKITEEQYAIAATNGINKHTAYTRVTRLDWSVEKAITQPVTKKLFLTDEQFKIAASNGISRDCAYQRVKNYKWSIEDAITKPIARGLTKEEYRIAAENGISQKRAYERMHLQGWSVEKAITKPTHSRKPVIKKGQTSIKEYAVYKGEELLIIGTAEECAKELNVTVKTIHFCSYPSYLKRIGKSKKPSKALVSVLLDDDE